tara:strand:+ start:371 stop:1033 length:663 start_codon:yes stop_codon:yes gene_type:complete
MAIILSNFGLKDLFVGTTAISKVYHGVTQIWPVTVTNLCKYSEQLDHAEWASLSSGVSVVANATIAPDGNVTADEIIESATTGPHYRRQGISGISPSTQYTYSVYLKANSRNAALMSISTNNSGSGLEFIHVNLANGTITNINTTDGDYGITPVGNGWYRVWIRNTMNATASSLDVRVYPYHSTTYSGINYAGNGVSSIYAWGAQVEQRAYAEKYQVRTA